MKTLPHADINTFETMDRLRGAVGTALPSTISTEENDRLRQSLLAKLPSFPEAVSFAAKVLATGDNRIHTAEDVLGERIIFMLQLLGGNYHYLHSGGKTTPTGDDDLKVVTRALWATPYLWKAHCISAVMGMEMPRHVVSRSILPQPRMWWTLETAFGVYGENGDKIGIADAYLVSDEGEGVTFTEFASGNDPDGEFTSSEGHWLAGQYIRYGSTYPDDFPGFEGPVGQSLAMLAFLNSPYIPKHPVRLPRQMRRSSVRVGGTAGTDVTFVDLRRPTVRGEPDNGNGSREWKHKWVVQGHLRAQWYPSEQAHHVIYIAPYMKGPEDAPLLEHVYRVKR